jgi:hypothetical protein
VAPNRVDPVAFERSESDTAGRFDTAGRSDIAGKEEITQRLRSADARRRPPPPEGAGDEDKRPSWLRQLAGCRMPPSLLLQHVRTTA